jgi:anti-sigma B factor antagonist
MKQTEKIRVENKSGYIWVFMPDAISRDDFRVIENEISALLTAEANRLVLDLSETNNIYSSGLGLLIRLNKMALGKNGAMHLVNVSSELRELFSLVNLDKYFSIYESDIEFQVLQDDAWQYTRRKDPIAFLCFHQVENGVCLVHLSGKMTVGNESTKLNESLYDETVRVYMFDMLGLDILDAVGADTLCHLIAHIDSRGGACLAFGANEIVKDLLHVLHGDLKLAFFNSEEDALKSIGK